MSASIIYRLFCETEVVSYAFFFSFGREIGTRLAIVKPFAHAQRLTSALSNVSRSAACLKILGFRFFSRLSAEGDKLKDLNDESCDDYDDDDNVCILPKACFFF